MSHDMTGHCYCGNVAWKSSGPIAMKFECYCRECRYISGGGPVIGFAVMNEGFALTKGQVKGFSHPDYKHAVTREFCGDCGTHLFTRAPGFPQGVIVKAGSLDNEADFDGPAFAAFSCDARPWHRLPTELPVHERWPG